MARGPFLRLLSVAGLGIVGAAVLFAGPAVPQDPGYHQFADRRPWLDVPHFANVASNLPFLFVGAVGLGVTARRAAFLDPRERYPYYVLFLGVGLTAFGSAYYHWHPDNDRLVWDRLPMTLAFMGLFGAILAERAGVGLGVGLLPGLLLAGVGSVVYWHTADDLRPYYLVQFYPMAAIPLLLLLFPPRYTGSGYLFAALGAYVLAKVCEMRWDEALYREVGVSGHTVKHLLAALAASYLVVMIRTRRVLSPPAGSRPSPPSIPTP